MSDLGDLDYSATQTRAQYLRSAEAAAGAILSDGRRMLAIGGDHLVTLGLVRGALRRGPLQIVQIDAHSDIQSSGQESEPTHGNFMSYLLDEPGVRRVVQIGVRGWGRTPPSTHTKVVRASPAQVSTALLDDAPVYLTIDTDGFDPVVAPAVGHPVHGGLVLSDLVEILAQIRGSGCPLIAADWTEFNPSFDTPNAISAWTVLRGLALIAQHWEAELRPRKGRG